VNPDDVLKLLDGVRPSGKGWTARCPAHEDRHASLSVGIGEEGRILLKCFAGCDAEAIVSALGLTLADLMPEREPDRRLVATYDYTDETGSLLYQVLRYYPKMFKQRRPDGNGGWAWNLNGVPRVLYGLPAIKASGTRRVLVVEGEKDCEALKRFGFIATTNSGGAGKWSPEHSKALRGRHVVVLPDDDEPGRKHAEAIAQGLAGVAASVNVLELPGLPQKGDASDWLAAGGTVDELKRLAKGAPDAASWLGSRERLREAQRSEEHGAAPRGEGGRTGFRLESMESLLDSPEEKVRWIVEGMLPAGGTSLIVAKPKVGKSTLSRQLALAVARGEPFLGRDTSKGPVVILAFEEKRGEARAHLRAMGGARADEVHLHFGSAPDNAIAELRALVEKLKPALVIVDPLFRLAGVRDANDYAQVLRALAPLTDLARETGAHVSAVHHAGKGEREGADAILGSTAIFGSVDTAVLMKRGAEFRTISTVQRYGEDLPESVLSFDREAKTAELAGTRAEAEEERISAEVLAALAGKQPTGEEDLLADIEARTGPKRKVLRLLVKDGKVSRTGSGKRGDPFRYGPVGNVDPEPSATAEGIPLGPESDSRFLFPHISGNEETRNEREAPGPPQERVLSRSHDSGEQRASGTTIGNENPSVPDEVLV